MKKYLYLAPLLLSAAACGSLLGLGTTDEPPPPSSTTPSSSSSSSSGDGASAQDGETPAESDAADDAPPGTCAPANGPCGTSLDCCAGLTCKLGVSGRTCVPNDMSCRDEKAACNNVNQHCCPGLECGLTVPRRCQKIVCVPAGLCAQTVDGCCGDVDLLDACGCVGLICCK